MLAALVVGAGPAGSTAALLLARAKKDVCIVERSAFPRTKVCGEYLNPGCVRVLHELGLGTALAGYARPVRGVRLHGYGVHARIDFPSAGWSLPRAVLDETLLRAALGEGAALLRGHVEDCVQDVNAAGVRVRLPDGGETSPEAEIVIGADGMHSVIARKCGMDATTRGPSRFAVGGHYDGFAALDDYIDMFVDGSTYLAVNPLSEHSANVMFIVRESDLQQHRGDLEAFLSARAHRLARELFTCARLVGKRVAIGPLAHRTRRFARSRVLLAGDAASFLDPFTGQGVSFALASARFAAQCVLDGRPGAYHTMVRREIGSRQRTAGAVSALLHSPLLARTAAAVMRDNAWLAAGLVRRVTGAA